MACGLTAGRRGEQKPGISKYPQLRWVRSDGWIFRAVIRRSSRLRICGGSKVVTRFFQASSESSHTQKLCEIFCFRANSLVIAEMKQDLAMHKIGPALAGGNS